MIRVALLTISDRCSTGEREDISGKTLRNAVDALGWSVVEVALVPDEREQIQECLIHWSDSGLVDVILTTGGTGFSPRDITPEATLSVLDRQTPGIVEAMRAASLKITPHAMLSRAQAGIRKQTLIINLPGSPRSVTENLEVIAPVIPHAVSLLQNAPLSEKGHRPDLPD